jgi:hypothetical protein
VHTRFVPSKWNQQSPLSRRLAREGRLVSIIREMAGGGAGDGAVVVEAVRRQEGRAAGAPFCTAEPVECGEETGRYRRIDGACNNLARPGEGAAGRRLARLLPSTYRDGAGLPRGGAGLPGARTVSAALHHEPGDPVQLALRADTTPDRRHTHLLMEFGHFLAHDISLTSQVD